MIMFITIYTDRSLWVIDNMNITAWIVKVYIDSFVEEIVLFDLEFDRGNGGLGSLGWLLEDNIG